MKIRYIAALIGSALLTACSGTRPPLGLMEGKLMPCPDSPNCVNSQIESDEEHSIKPLLYSGNLADTRSKLLQVLEAEERAKTITADSNYIYAEYTSALFRFVDDVEFYLIEEADDRCIIHIRSASRLGHSDFGVNRERIERIRGKLSQ
ncbi:DUF1499 domain-containing protein [Vibrio sp. JC009]|uniref:DUF1499 domain-containing protein n=1 Tax=Vibrio sp. JC009 TaxID=2912314 RepID=UPI0023B1DE89|nr:DUF1499 domain-containing protein [Vibrio sp. JC009]WED21326.1 DUF1499 domain-containing protein [Vibrio sp. JC009]